MNLDAQEIKLHQDKSIYCENLCKKGRITLEWWLTAFFIAWLFNSRHRLNYYRLHHTMLWTNSSGIINQQLLWKEELPYSMTSTLYLYSQYYHNTMLLLSVKSTIDKIMHYFITQTSKSQCMWIYTITK